MAGANFKICLVYLDDILIFSKDIQSHVDRLRIVLAKLREANLKIKPSKCHFLKQSVEFLGYVVSKEGVQTDPKKVETVKNRPVPHILREL